ncbi:MAG: hypothetical protein ACXAE3_09785 [Candidatus Kariarchaeaceae archaeon]|jgi:hypothetical protein
MSTERSAEQVGAMINDLLIKTGYLDVFAIIKVGQSAHLSRIARLMGKSKSTVLKTIESMLAERLPLIEIDNERTLHTKGVKKFYRLSDLGHQLDIFIDQSISNDNIPTETPGLRDSKTEEEYRETIINEATGLLSTFTETQIRAYFTLGAELNFYFQRASAETYIELGKLGQSERGRKSVKHVPYGTFFSSLKRVSVSSFDQVNRIIDLTNEFLTEFKTLEDEIQQENKEKIERGSITEDDLDSQIVFINLNPIIDEY